MGITTVFDSQDRYLKTDCGIPAFVSPEVIQGKPYTEASDIWSAGIFLYILVTGKLPFFDLNAHKLLQLISISEPKYPPTLPSNLVDLLQKILVKDPSKRITLKEIQESSWLTKSPHPEYSFKDFGISEKYRILAKPGFVPDPDILAKIKKVGLNPETVTQSNGKDPSFILYKIFKREKVTRALKALSVNPEKDVVKGPSEFDF